MKYQTTRKLWMLLLTAALLALLFLPAALAEETLPSVHVTLGDGEPIGYFDGFEGNFLKSADSVKGVTGRLSKIRLDLKETLYFALILLA